MRPPAAKEEVMNWNIEEDSMKRNIEEDSMKRVIVATALMLVFVAVPAAAQFTDWSAPVNLGPVVNSTSLDQCVAVSKNGLSLYFSSMRPSPGGRDLYVSKRASLSDPWGVPQVLPNINSPSDESCPALSLDEHRLYFASARPGGCGATGTTDLYVSRRHDRQDDFGWEPPVNLGCMSDGYVNSPWYDQTPNFFEDESGTVVMYFATARPPFVSGYDIYASPMRNDDTFGPGTPVTELNSLAWDLGPAVRRDGLELIFSAGALRGGMGGFDLWTATRKSTADPWSAPVNLTVLNSTANEIGRLCFSFDGRAFYFASNRPGGNGGTDIYITTREKLRVP